MISHVHAGTRARPVRISLLRRAAACIAILVAALCGSARAESRGRISYDEIQIGMKGYGKTVFTGTTIDTFDVEVIGKIDNIAPKGHIILARLSGGPLAQTGVMEGMSGSPVYLDGKLAGAVAYTWSFAKEPICGITPIEEMLDILSRKAERRSASAGGARGVTPAKMDLLARPAAMLSFLKERMLALGGQGAPRGLAPIRTPLALGAGPRRGAVSKELGEWESAFSSMGFSMAGAAGRADEPAPAIEPGSAIGVQLVRGDVEFSGIGTVTYVKGDDILAFGHPMFMLGPTALPMTGAKVQALFPSNAQSFKLASVTGPAGLVSQDRFAGLAGKLGGDPPMVPVSLHLISSGDRATDYSFELAEDPLLTPIFFHMAMLEILGTAEKQVGDVTLSVEKGSRIKLEGGLDVQLQNLYSGDESETIASGTIAYMTYLLMNNPDRPSRVEGIELTLRYSDALSLARIERIWCEKYTVAPGETLPLYVVVHPYRGEPFTEMVPLEIPEEAPEGKTILQVGDAVTLSRMEFQAASGASFQPTSLEQLIYLLNRIRTNDRIYATLIRPDSGAFVAGSRMPNLPPSISTVLLIPEHEEAGATRVKLRGLLEAERETGYALRGYQKTILEIKR